jgi:DNA-binding beta-propeller fold protein YncE
LARENGIYGRLVAAVAVAWVLVLPLAGSARAAGCSASPACPYADVIVLGADPPSGHGVFRFPQAIAFSPGGSYVFVADQYSGLVQKFDRQGAWVAQLGWYADHGQLRRLGVIGGLATDRNNHVYVLDSENDRVQVFRSDTGEWLGAWGSRGTSAGLFQLGANTGAGGIALYQPGEADPPIVFIADQDNHRIERFTLDQKSSADPSSPVLPSGTRDGAEYDYIPFPTVDRVWGSFGDCATNTSCGGTPARYVLNHPQGIAVDAHADNAGKNHVYVADDDNHRVVAYDLDGNYLNEVGTFGTNPGQFRFPYDVGVDSGDQLFVADNNNHRVQRFNAFDLSFSGQWGSFGTDSGNLEFPRSLAALADDPLGGAYVADTANNRIQGFDPNGGVTAGWGTAGRGPGYVTRPADIATDRTGDVYVADTWDHRIEKLSSSGAFLGQWGYISSSSGYAAVNSGNGQFRFPGGVAFDPASGNIWVADSGNNRIQELTPDGGWLATFGGTATGTAPGQFNDPTGIAVSSAGDVYVADTLNNRLQKRDSAGTWSDVSVGGQLDQPRAVALDRAGNIYVADRTRVLKITGPDTTEITPPSGAFDQPAGLWATTTHLYVSDTGNDRVLRMNFATGQWESFGGDGPELGSFVVPAGLTTAPGANSLYVADQYNNRIQKFLFTRAAPAAASQPIPKASSKPAVRDQTRPKLRLRARLRQRALRAGVVVLSLNCTEHCTFTALGRIAIHGRHKTFPLRRVKGQAVQGIRVKLRLKIPAKTRRRLRRALLHKALLTAVVTVRAQDDAGNPAAERRRIRIKG